MVAGIAVDELVRVGVRGHPLLGYPCRSSVDGSS